MTRWAVVLKHTDVMLAVRADKARCDAHLAYAKAHPQLLIGGGLKPVPDAGFCGALWIMEAATWAEIETLMIEGPFHEGSARRFETFT